MTISSCTFEVIVAANNFICKATRYQISVCIVSHPFVENYFHHGNFVLWDSNGMFVATLQLQVRFSARTL